MTAKQGPPRKAYKSALRIHVLAIIISEKRIHGYGIYKKILERTRLIRRFGKPSVGTIYRVLNNLVEEGLVSREEEKIGGRTLYYYGPTKKGLDEFTKICEAFLDKVYSGSKMIISAIPSLEASGVNIEGIINRFREIRELIEKKIPTE